VSKRPRKSTNWKAVGLFAGMMAVALSRALPETVQKAIWWPAGAAIILLLCYATGRSIFARLGDKGAEGGCLVLARKTRPFWLYLGAAAVAFATVVAALSAARYQLFASADLQVGLSLGGFLFGTLTTLLGSIQLRVTTQKIEYWSLERGYQVLERDEIDVARFMASRSSSAPYLRLEVLPHDEKKKPIYLPVMAFQRADMDRVREWLGSKLEDESK